MHEDVVGPLRASGHAVQLCSLCGAAYPTDQLTPVEGEPLEGLRSERADICPDCRQALAQGDDPAFPLEAEGNPAGEG